MHLMDVINHSKETYSTDTNILKIVEDHLNSKNTLFETVHKKNKFDSAKKNGS